MTKQQVVRSILKGEKFRPKQKGEAFAPANIALVKYWGKRDEELNLPVTSSLSVSLSHLGTRTTITIAKNRDSIFLNGEAVSENSVFYQRIVSFLDLFRFEKNIFFKVQTSNNIPTAAGLASSASGFAALVLALNDLYNWGLSRKELSILARLGSGSASRSLFAGFVLWHAGSAADGLDSFAEPLPQTWPELRIGLVTVTEAQKPISSRQAMKRTVQTSALYKAWPTKVEQDLANIQKAIREKDITLLGRTAESNALAMHATMLGAQPPVLYWLPETISIVHRVQALRRQDVPVYLTIDAGPNVKLLFEKETEKQLGEFKFSHVVEPFIG